MSTSSVIKLGIKEARVRLIRHAKSRFNQDWPPNLQSKDGIPLPREKLYAKEHHAFAIDPNYIDCGLCEEGIKQCEEAS